MSDLRSKVIRLAHLNPELQALLLPLLSQRTAGESLDFTTKLAVVLSDFSCSPDPDTVGRYNITGVLTCSFLNLTQKGAIKASVFRKGSGNVTRFAQPFKQNSLKGWDLFLNLILDQIWKENPGLLGEANSGGVSAKVTLPVNIDYSFPMKYKDQGVDHVSTILGIKIGKEYQTIHTDATISTYGVVVVEVGSAVGYLAPIATECITVLLDNAQFKAMPERSNPFGPLR